MTGLDPRLGMSGVMALRQRILERSEALGQALGQGGVRPAAPTPVDGSGAFTRAMGQALEAVNDLQKSSDSATSAWERGETHDIAEVMLARQKASIAFEATLQARNRLLGAYRDILNMPV
jgi:flagellar hook-basal body complex protein FliE